MRKLAINGRFLSQAITGVQRYALEVVKSLDRLMAGGEIDPQKYCITVLTPTGRQYEIATKHVHIVARGRMRGHGWEQLELPVLSRGTLLWSPCGAAPLLHSRSVVTIHDASVFSAPQGYTAAFREWYRWQFKQSARSAKAIITDSDFSKRELERWLRTDSIRRVYLGHEHILEIAADRSVIEKHGLTDIPFLFAVSSANPNKNFAGLLRALNQISKPGFRVVIAGGRNRAVFAGEELEFPDFVTHVGYVTDAQLRALYEQAAAFVFPSHYEGFGLPSLEAMACGCPVIASRAASIPEVCGDAAVYINPTDPHDIAEAIARVMKDAELRARLKGAGRERSGRLRWDDTARAIWRVLEPNL